MLPRIAVLLCLGLGLAAGEARADEPSDAALVGTGLAVAVPTYMIGVMVHEGSHALAAKMLGAEITDYSLVPGFHPRNDKFYFGYVSVRGMRTPGEKQFFYIAPKLSDSLLLGGYGLAYGLDAMPSNAYAHVALTVFATGFWVDFSKDIFAFWDHNDTFKFYQLIGLDSEWKRRPARVLHLGLSAAMGYVLYRNYRGIFADPGTASASFVSDTPAAALPLLQMTF
jgi:hypothetical protein